MIGQEGVGREVLGGGGKFQKQRQLKQPRREKNVEWAWTKALYGFL